MSKSINKMLAVLSLALVFAASTGLAAGTMTKPTKPVPGAPSTPTKPAPAPAPAAPASPTGTIAK